MPGFVSWSNATPVYNIPFSPIHSYHGAFWLSLFWLVELSLPFIVMFYGLDSEDEISGKSLSSLEQDEVDRPSLITAA